MFKLHQDKINAAIEMIQSAGLDKVCCSLTGMPYATIDREEIDSVLTMQCAVEFTVTVGQLVDSWQLTHWTLCSQPAPAFRNMHDESIGLIVGNLPQGNRRAAGYFIGRLLFPDSIETRNGRWFKGEKIQFLVEMQAALSEAPDSAISELLENLSLIDSLVGLAEWKARSNWRRKFEDRIEQIKGNYDLSALIKLTREIYDSAIEWFATRSKVETATDRANRLAASGYVESTSVRLQRDAQVAKAEALNRDGIIRKDGDEATLSLARWYEDRDIKMPDSLAKRVNAIRVKRQWKAKPNTGRTGVDTSKPIEPVNKPVTKSGSKSGIARKGKFAGVDVAGVLKDLAASFNLKGE